MRVVGFWKSKDVNGKRIIQARLVVRGFKDLEASQPKACAGDDLEKSGWVF